MARLCGATLGLFAFSTTIFISLYSGSGIEETITRAVTAMALFCGLGLCVGGIAGRVLDEYVGAKEHELDARAAAAHSAASAAPPEQTA